MLFILKSFRHDNEGLETLDSDVISPIKPLNEDTQINSFTGFEKKEFLEDKKSELSIKESENCIHLSHTLDNIEEVHSSQEEQVNYQDEKPELEQKIKNKLSKFDFRKVKHSLFKDKEAMVKKLYYSEECRKAPNKSSEHLTVSDLDINDYDTDSESEEGRKSKTVLFKSQSNKLQ